MSTTTGLVDTIVQEITIKTPAARVFEALVDSAQRMKWWGQKKPRMRNPICGPAAGG